MVLMSTWSIQLMWVCVLISSSLQMYCNQPWHAWWGSTESSSSGFRDEKSQWMEWDESRLGVVLIAASTLICFCCVFAVVLGAPLFQPTAFPWWAGAEERCWVGQTGLNRGQRDACQGRSRHCSSDAGQQPGTRSVKMLMKALSLSGHSKCCTVGSRTYFSCLKRFHLSSKCLLQF